MIRRTLPASVVFAATCALSAHASAQILPGHSITAGTAGPSTARVGEMYDVDHQAGTAAKLTIPSALQTAFPNAVLMETAVTGFVGTNSPGDIYAIVVTGGTVTATQLNTTATAGANVAQLVRFGTKLYFTTQGGTAGGVLQSVPVAGGPVQQELDLGTLTGVPDLANALTMLGSKLYIGTFNSGPITTTNTTSGHLVEFDIASSKGTVVMPIPLGVWQTNSTNGAWSMGVVNMHAHPDKPGLLALFGVYGDYFEIDPIAKTLVTREFTGPTLINGGNNSINSAAYDPSTKDWVIGTRDGYVERWVGGQSAEKIIPGVGSDPTPTNNGVAGVHHFPPTKGVDYTTGDGCAGTGGWEPTDVSYGAPTAGNSAFRLALHSGVPGDPCVLMVGVAAPAFDLGPAGAPGCKLRITPVVLVATTMTGSAPGDAHAVIPAPIPASTPLGTKVSRQWLVINRAPVNPAGFVLSNARFIDVQ